MIAAIKNFQNGCHWKHKNCYNFGLHVNICITMCVLVTSYVTNHNKNVRMHHLVLVIAPLRIFKMATTENSKYLHVFHAPHIVLSIEAIGVYHHNFGLHVNMCMLFYVLMASCITNHTKCEDPTSIPSHDPERLGMVPDIIAIYYRHGTFLSHNMIQQCIKGGTDSRALMSMSTGIS